MNFRIILHLVLADWKKYNWLFILLWCGIFVSFASRMSHDNWQSIADVASSVPGKPESPFASKGSFIGLLLAAALGLQRELSQLSPVRARERAIAKFITLLLLMVAPQALCVAVNLYGEGFPLEVAMRAAAGYGLTVLLILGVAALFSTWCASWWHALAGVTAVAGIYSIYSMIPCVPPLPSLRLFDSHMWRGIPEARGLLALVLSIFLLGGFRLIRRGRLSAGQQVGTAVAIVIGSLAASVLPGLRIQRTPSSEAMVGTNPDTAAIRPVIRPDSVWMQSSADEYAGAMNAETRIFKYKTFVSTDCSSAAGIIDTAGAQPGQFVVWQPSQAGSLQRDGRTVATRVQDINDDYSPSSRSVTGYPLENVDPQELAAMADALSNKRHFLPEPKWNQISHAGLHDRYRDDQSTELHTYLGCFSPTEPMISWDEGELTLESLIGGTVYRYEQTLDVPLHEGQQRVAVGDTIYQIKGNVSVEEGNCAELTVVQPALGFAGKAAEPEPNEIPWRYFLHSPGKDLTMPLGLVDARQRLAMAGATWQRHKIGHTWLGQQNRMLKSQYAKQFGLTEDKLPDIRRLNELFTAADAHLIVLRPVVVGCLPAVRVSTQVRQSRDSQRIGDYALNYRDGINDWVFLNDYLTNRPDPRTCSREEFGRWLRVAADAPAFAFAGYAKRFTDIMVRVPRYGVQNAIERETPASERGAVIAQLTKVDEPAGLIHTLSRRGWANECADAIRWCYLHRYRGCRVLPLEDPATYPKLIRTADFRDYEQIRLLPGIGPELDRAVAEAITALSQTDLQTAMWNIRSEDFAAIYQMGAAKGNAKALDIVIAIQNALNERYRRVGSRPELSLLEGLVPEGTLSGELWKEWTEHLNEKSSKDLSYDPLTCRWQLLQAQ